METTSLPETYKALQSQGPNTSPAIDSVPLSKPGFNQVVVKIEYAALNPSDIYALHGAYRPTQGKASVGNEGSGTIVAVGENLLVPHKVGDRVHVSGPGTYSQYLVTKSESCFPIQGDLSFEQAASHMVNPGTVYYMGVLAERGGHKAAIHNAGSSALGRMLIRYFKQKGIKTINVVRRDDFNEELTKEGADYILNSQAPDFEAKLKEIAEKEQATIAFDAISGEFTGKLVRAQPPGSTCYVYGALSGDREIKGVGIMDLFQQKNITGLYLTNYITEVVKKGEAGKFFHEVHGLLGTVFRSEVQKVFSLDDFQEALAYYKDNSSKGKILFKPN